jgi:hypothetical protein
MGLNASVGVPEVMVPARDLRHMRLADDVGRLRMALVVGLSAFGLAKSLKPRAQSL